MDPINPIAMKKLTTILLLFFFGISFGQHPGTGQCTLKPENKDWLLEYKKAKGLDYQIDLIVQKINADNGYFEANPAPDNLNDKRVFGALPCSNTCAIRFGLMYSKRDGIVLDLTKNPEFQDLLSEFNADNISRIELNESHDKDIYKHKTHKRSGIVLYTSDKELKKKIKKAIKNSMKS
jgi:hypothetical protein